MSEERVKMEETIIFRAPKSFKEKLEQYCARTGYNISDVIRRAVDAQIISPKVTLTEIWYGIGRLTMEVLREMVVEDLVILTGLCNLIIVMKEELVKGDYSKKILEETLSFIYEFMKARREDIKYLDEVRNAIDKEDWEKVKNYLMAERPTRKIKATLEATLEGLKIE
jgi:hypothetical protein